MIDECAHDPCDAKLEEDNPDGGLPAVEFPVHGADGGGAGDVQQAEYHHCIGVCGAEAHGGQSGGHGAHAVGGGDVLDPEEYAAAGNDDFFCRDSGDERYNDLPVAKACRTEQRNRQFSDHGAEALGDVGYVSGGAEVQDHPQDNGSHEDHGSGFGQVVFDLLPDIDGDGPRIWRFIFRQFDQQGVGRFASVYF